MSRFFRILKRNRTTGVPAVLVLTILPTLILAGCHDLQLQSRWRDRVVLVDGQNSEWQDALTYLKDENASVGVLNDDTYLYLSVISTNRRLSGQVMHRGMTLWFDPGGGKKKVFGVHFPLGSAERGEMRNLMERGGMFQNQDLMQEQFEQTLTDLEILGPGKDESHRVSVKEAEAQDIYVNLNATQEGFVYELRIPLESGPECPVAIGVKPGGLIGVRMETPEIDMSMMRGRGDDSRPPGGMRGGGRGGMPSGGGPPGMGRPGGGSRGGFPEPLKVWAKIQLAAADTTEQILVDSGAVSR